MWPRCIQWCTRLSRWFFSQRDMRADIFPVNRRSLTWKSDSCKSRARGDAPTRGLHVGGVGIFLANKNKRLHREILKKVKKYEKIHLAGIMATENRPSFLPFIFLTQISSTSKTLAPTFRDSYSLRVDIFWVFEIQNFKTLWKMVKFNAK